MERLRWAIDLLAVGVELLGVGVMAALILVATVRWLAHAPREGVEGYRRYRTLLGRALLIGLEILVAADVIRTVAVEPSLESFAVLAVLVGIRTFVGWSVTVELEGRWPWRGGDRTGQGP